MATRVPVTNVPADRPKCVYCGKPLAMMTHDTYGDKDGRHHVVLAREFAFWRGYDLLFCTLNHARQFARAAYRAGYRMVVAPPKE